ncbi:UDP-glucuronosyl/UDP-glucosyltransferase protein [Dioscorea alata]|uniref:UDP-glucuronosyl/UDP-glucosyltransferase protein n=1 Tax=Dioscorea alata TaxID=55571 RepID=A0ACB7UHU1_DIOAL|nr:UDP-glucuronosyl/UDP-glucosyltransferase protein [Dioscorea alata]
MVSAKSVPHVAFLAFPFGTHASPLFSLARALAADAPSTAFSFFNSARSNSSLLQSLPSGLPPNLRTFDVPDNVPEGTWLPPVEVRLFLEVTPGNFLETMAAAEGEFGRVTCVVGDAFLWFAGDVAAERGASWVALWTGGPCSLAAHLYTDLLRDTFGVEDQARANDLLDIIPGLQSLRVGDLPEGVVFGNIKSAFADLLHQMGQKLPHATCVVINTSDGLNPELDLDFQAKFKKCLNVGPLSHLFPQPLDPEKHGCLAWLDTQIEASVVYISFGTVIMPSPQELTEMAAGLEASGVPFLWSLKDMARKHLPEGFLDRVAGRGLVVPWAPQTQVLGHLAVGAFLTHCGWNSVLESISCGVPLICRPFFGDQCLNAKTVSCVWEIGVAFESRTMEKEDMVRVLNVVLKTEEGKKMSEKADKLKTTALQATKPGGNSIKNFDTLVKMIVGNHGS